jgi:glutathione S-transferase
MKKTCSFSAKVMAVLDAYGIPFKMEDISNEHVANELMALGGKHQTPFIIDGNVMLYDSQSIISYIEQKYGKKKGEKPRIHYARGLCQI